MCVRAHVRACVRARLHWTQETRWPNADNETLQASSSVEVYLVKTGICVAHFAVKKCCTVRTRLYVKANTCNMNNLMGQLTFKINGVKNQKGRANRKK